MPRESVTSLSLVSNKSDVFHPFASVTRGSSAEIQSQTQDQSCFVEGKNRWLVGERLRRQQVNLVSSE